MQVQCVDDVHARKHSALLKLGVGEEVCLRKCFDSASNSAKPAELPFTASPHATVTSSYALQTLQVL